MISWNSEKDFTIKSIFMNLYVLGKILFLWILLFYNYMYVLYEIIIISFVWKSKLQFLDCELSPSFNTC